MNSQESNQELRNEIPQAVVRPGRSFSIIWVIPVIALLIGGWLALKAWSEQGPVIQIVFETAEGLEAGKTKIRFKDVEVGRVTAIEISEDLSHVIVTAEMKKSLSNYLRDKTHFWVVRARVAAGEVSGLGTLFSGAYIACNPSPEGEFTSRFVGQEKPPVISTGIPGRYYLLQAETLGSLDIGSPVYYRGINVGKVVNYDFDSNAETIQIRIFINAPYHEKVHGNTRFWNASGVDLKLDTKGVKIDTQSLVSILLGGIAFDLPSHVHPAGPAEEDQLFPLFDNQDKLNESSYIVKHYYLMYFDENVRGLVAGAPVEIRGIRIGEVMDVDLEVNVDDASARVAVLVMIEPERIDTLLSHKTDILSTADDITTKDDEAVLTRLVNHGLRAQLQHGNLLTGQLYIELDFFDNVSQVKLEERNGYLVMPTLPTRFEQIAERVSAILKKVERMPLEEISVDLRRTINTLNETLQKTGDVAGGVNRELLPELKKTLDEVQVTVRGFKETYGADSTLEYNVRKTLTEVSAAMRSLRMLVDYIERNPQSVIFGKQEESVNE